MSCPTIANLRKFFPLVEARQLRGLMDGTIDPKQYVSVQRWIAQCYNEPSHDELVMCAIDEVLGGFGVEAIRGRYVDRYHHDIQAAYVNMGDTYNTTILLDHETDSYRLTSWGDWVEANERKRQLF